MAISALHVDIKKRKESTMRDRLLHFLEVERATKTSELCLIPNVVSSQSQVRSRGNKRDHYVSWKSLARLQCVSLETKCDLRHRTRMKHGATCLHGVAPGKHLLRSSYPGAPVEV
ncbi:hypothetical protein AVEN_77127-1 [Araneus ventricosus]|uniref:Uncharacterized protein n=1 Tax=Araneus ventricosus TaxID=182803 RepID=A0A4Y2IQR7_ARAVE|nr:hypothetical protein AVEN_77127-1 [Araneus ventricosus]